MDVRKQNCSDECKEAGKAVMVLGAKLQSPHERVRVIEWLRWLNANVIENDENRPTLAQLKMKHEYLEYLRICLQGDYQILTKPFNLPPPEHFNPLAEVLGNVTADEIPDIPRCGNLQPVLCHKSGDDRAFMCIKRTPDRGFLCYMAVAPDSSSLKY